MSRTTVHEELLDYLSHTDLLSSGYLVCHKDRLPKYHLLYGNRPYVDHLADNNDQVLLLTCQSQYDTAHSTPYAHGAAMMVKREVIEKAGLMPECYFLYYEELDWSMMIRRAGYEIWYEPACTVFHKESQTTGQNSPLRTYYITRNRLLFTQRNQQGMTKYISYLYLISLVATRDILKYAFLRRMDLVQSTIRGIVSFIKL